MTTVWLARSSSKGWRWIGVDHFPGIFPVQVDLAVDNRNQAHLAYYDGQATQLKYAIVEQGDALRRIVLDSEGDVGWNPSIALDVYGQPHISYYDASRKDLKHAYLVRPSNLLYLPLVRH